MDAAADETGAAGVTVEVGPVLGTPVFDASETEALAEEGDEGAKLKDGAAGAAGFSGT